MFQTHHGAGENLSYSKQILVALPQNSIEIGQIATGQLQVIYSIQYNAARTVQHDVAWYKEQNDDFA
jgi:hypothetical protein